METPAGALSYAQLVASGADVARWLRAAGVACEDRVGILPRAVTQLAPALLGTFWAGAAAVPLDPLLPTRQRLERLDAAGVRAVAVGERRAGSPFAQVVVGAGSPAVTAPAEGGERQEACPGGLLAYVVLTSGSTGEPKRVGVERGPLATHLEAVAGAFALTPADRVLLFAPPGVDVHLEQLLAPLLVGATVVQPPLTATAAGPLRDVVDRRGVTVVNLTASQCLRFLDAVTEGGWPARLRMVVSGSEPFPDRLLQAWRSCAPPHAQLVNAYGPTETVITAMAHPVHRDEATQVPIGTTVGPRSACLADGRDPVDTAPAAELHVAGLVARGYLDDPRATGAAFVPAPGGRPWPGARAYRTGDRVTARADGALVFHGRVDDQVKIAGFRVEPAGVERCLEALRGVRRAVVVPSPVPGDGGLQVRLAALVEASADGADMQRLLREARAGLPPHMVPSAAFAVPEVPLTPSGKVDRRRAAALARQLLVGAEA